MEVQRKVIDWLKASRSDLQEQVEIIESTDLLSNGMLDSLGFLQLVTFIEDEFNVIIPVEALAPENFSTPASVSTLVNSITAQYN